MALSAFIFNPHCNRLAALGGFANTALALVAAALFLSAGDWPGQAAAPGLGARPRSAGRARMMIAHGKVRGKAVAASLDGATADLHIQRLSLLISRRVFTRVQSMTEYTKTQSARLANLLCKLYSDALLNRISLSGLARYDYSWSREMYSISASIRARVTPSSVTY